MAPPFGGLEPCTSRARARGRASREYSSPVRSRDRQIDFELAPDPEVGLGVFETLLVLDGQARELDRHLERLRSSVRALYGSQLPDGLRARVRSAGAGQALARLRIDFVPGTPEVGVQTSPLDPGVVLGAAEVALATVAVPAGPGAHKLIDRRWLARIEAAAGEGVAPLLVSRSGALLETTRANVFLLRDGELATPPLDGSILPGVIRALLLERARALGIPAREVALTLADLHGADTVLLSNSLRLLERARVRPGRRSAEALARLREAIDPRGGGA